MVRALKLAQARSVVVDRLPAVVIRCLGERDLFLLNLLGQLVSLFIRLSRCLPRGCSRVDGRTSIRTEVDNVCRHDLLCVLPHENRPGRRVAGVAAESLLACWREGVWVDQAVHDEDGAASARILVWRAHVAVHAVHTAAQRKAVHAKNLLVEAVQRDRSRSPYVGCPMVDIAELALQCALGTQHALLLFILGLPHAHPTLTNRRDHAPLRDQRCQPIVLGVRRGQRRDRRRWRRRRRSHLGHLERPLAAKLFFEPCLLIKLLQLGALFQLRLDGRAEVFGDLNLLRDKGTHGDAWGRSFLSGREKRTDRGS